MEARSGFLGGIAFAGLLVAGSAAIAQTIRVEDVLLDMLRRGIRLAPTGQPIEHEAHFTSASTDQMFIVAQVNQGIARQLSGARIASSSGGFTYSFDPDLGVYSRATSSFGPIYGERSLTLGKGRYNLGVSFRSLSFDKLDALSLDEGDLYMVFEHVRDQPNAPDFEKDLVTARTALSINTNVATLVANYGVSDRLDVGIAIPVASVEYRAVTDFHIERLFTSGEPDIHRFPNGTDNQTTSADATASGAGDLILRSKYRFGATTPVLFATMLDVRVPTGEERDLLGTGSFQATGSLLGTLSGFNGSVHFGAGYSVAEADAPEEVLYGAGADVSVDPKLTLAFDLLGRQISGVTRVRVDPVAYDAAGGEVKRLPRLRAMTDETINVVQAATGAKVNVHGNLLLTFNYLFTLSDAGLSDRATPLIGLDYSF